MVVYTLGSDSGFGIGHDGIPDDFDEETGISVILWCIIFVFLLIVTIWFYITQLLPHRSTKCEIDDDDEDERVANRLLDPKADEKSSYDFLSCQPSTSNENAEDYEVIDGEVRIHYSNYEREASSNSNKAKLPSETTIPRRRSMEEMSLIFPGFLPIISEEEEEECEKNTDLDKDESVYKSRRNISNKDDNVEVNANTFIEQENSSESNNFNFEDKETRYFKSSAICISNNSHANGKKAVGNATTELRRRNFHIDDTDSLASQTQANENGEREALRETAVEKHTVKANGSCKEERIVHTNINLKHGNFISGSHNGDLQNQNIGNFSSEDPADTLIIAKESTVALATLSPDANENAVKLTSNDNHTICACARPSSVFNNNSEVDSNLNRKSSGVIEEVKPAVSKDDTKHISKGNELDTSDCAKNSTNMADQLTHAWTFYAVSDETTNDINRNREGSDHINDECKETPDIEGDLYAHETKHAANDSGIAKNSCFWQKGNGTMDVFETDIDVDDINLDDDLGDDPESDLNCFFKRHVSVTDLDKILSSQEMLHVHDEDNLNNESDLDEIMQGLTESVGKTNKRELMFSTGDHKSANDMKISRNSLKDEVLSNSTISEEHVGNFSKSVTSEVPLYSIISDGKLIEQERSFQLASAQQNSSGDNNEKFVNFSMRDLEYCGPEKKPPEMLSHVENDINTNDKAIKAEINTRKNIPVFQNGSVSAKIELKTGVYSYKTNNEDIGFLESKRNINSQVDNSSNIACININRSNVKNIANPERSRARTYNSKDVSAKEDARNRANSANSTLDRERKVGLTAEELSRVDLTRPVSFNSREEIIIGKKKVRKDSGSRPLITANSRDIERHGRTAVPRDPVTQSRKAKKTENAVNLPTKKISHVADKDSHFLTSDFQCYVEKRQVEQKPSLEKSVVLIPDKNQLQTRISVKDVHDTNFGFEISTNRPLEITRQKQIPTELEKPEEIAANQLKSGIESDNKDITCVVSNERQINWDNFLIDGLSLCEVSRKCKSPPKFVHDDVEFSPTTVRKPISLANEAQVTESFTARTLCPNEIDWEWFERSDINENKLTIGIVESADVGENGEIKKSYIPNVKDNVRLGTDLSNVSSKIGNAEKKAVCDKDCESSFSSSSSNDKSEDKNIEKRDQKSISTKATFDDNDVFSCSSQASQEPEFPVRLTKSFSELRNVEISTQSHHVRDPSFGRPDRSKSQTDVFQRQESQDDVFEDPDEHVFKTRITFDELYKNKRRIVILNIRKKSPSKTRWKSLNDLQSVSKHVVRLNSIGSLPEESASAGDSLALSSAQNKEAIFATSGSQHQSKEFHNNVVSSHASNPKSYKETVDRSPDEMAFDLNSKGQQEFSQSKVKQSNFTAIEQNLPSDDYLSKDNSDCTVLTLHPVYKAKSELVEPKVCSSEEAAATCFSPNESLLRTEKEVDDSVKNHKTSELNMHSKFPERNSFSSSTESTSQNNGFKSDARLLGDRQLSISPSTESLLQGSSLRSSGTVFAVSRHSPIPLSDFYQETSLQRQSSFSPTLDLANEDTSCISSVSSSGTMFTVSRHSPTDLKQSAKASLSSVRDQTAHDSNYRPSSGTMFAVNSHSPLNLKDTESEVRPKEPELRSPNRSPSPGTIFAVSRYSPTSSADSEVDNVLQRHQSMSPVRDISKSRSPSGRMFAVSRHSPSSPKDSAEKFLPRQSSLSPVQDVLQRNSSHQSSGTIFAVSRHSPTPLSDAKYVDKRPSPITNTSVSERAKGKEENNNEHLVNEANLEKKKELMVYPGSRSEATYQDVTGEERSLRKDISSSSEFKCTNQNSSSRRSSASSGYGGSRISPTSSLDGRHKAPKPSPSSEQVPQPSVGANSRCSSVSRISPPLSSDSECSNIDERKHFPSKHNQRETSRSGTVFAISRYTSAATDDNESPRVASRCNLLRENELKNSSTTMQKDKSKNSYATDQTASGNDDKFEMSKTSRSSSSELENDYKISDDGWLIKGEKKTISSVRNDQEHETRSVVVTDLDSLLNETNSAPASSHQQLLETDLDAIFRDKDRSSSEDKSTMTSNKTKSSEVETVQRSKVFVTTTTTGCHVHKIKLQSSEAFVSYTSPRYERTVQGSLDDDVFKTLTTKVSSKDYNELSFSSDADSETSSLSSIPLKPEARNTKVSSDFMVPTPLRLPSDSLSTAPSTPAKADPELLFFHPDLTSTPEVVKTVEITTTNSSLSREAAKESRQDIRQDKEKGSSLLTDSPCGAPQVKMRSKSDSQSISTEVQKSAFTPVQSRSKNRRSVSQECILDGSNIEQENVVLDDHPSFKEKANSHKSMPDLHTARETTEVDIIPEKTPYHSRLSAHTRIWLSQTAGIDTSNLCKDESVGSEIFLFPSKRFQPGRNVDGSFLSIASDSEDIPDDVSSRPSSPMSEFSFSGETPFGGKFEEELKIIACGHHLCGEEEVIRGREKTSYTSCPSCYTYYCSRECRQAHWREHKKSCFFGRINSYMRSFIYFCHKKENLKLLLSNIAVKNYASKGRGCVMVTFASPKQARKFMTSGCVLLPSPPSYPTVRELMREGVVSKHKVSLVHLVKDYDPRKEFVLNLAVVAGRLDDLPRHPLPRHKLNTVLECIKIPLSQSVMEPLKTIPDTTTETRVFYLPKCSRHEFINDMEARRHYCRNISKGLKSYGIRLKKDYPEAYESLCLYVEKNVPFKPLTVYGNEGSKIITCRIMPEASISAV